MSELMDLLGILSGGGGFLQDARLVLTIFGIVLVFKWVADNIPNRTAAVLILALALYYFLFYSPSIFMLITTIFAIVFLGAPIGGMMQDVLFQYDSAKRLDMPPEGEGYAGIEMTPMGPRWRQ